MKQLFTKKIKFYVWLLIGYSYFLIEQLILWLNCKFYLIKSYSINFGYQKTYVLNVILIECIVEINHKWLSATNCVNLVHIWSNRRVDCILVAVHDPARVWWYFYTRLNRFSQTTTILFYYTKGLPLILFYSLVF